MPIRLDERLTAIASYAAGDTVADIGCDHGKLAYFLAGTERAKKVIATDISAKCLKKTEELALANGAENIIDCRLGDGLDPLAVGEADTVVIAGMGGDVIEKIIRRAHAQNKRFLRLVLSPNTHPEKVRRALCGCGYGIVADEMTECAKKWYPIIVAESGKSSDLDEKRILLGAFYDKNLSFRRFAESECAKKRAITEMSGSEKIKAQLALLTEALEENYENI